MPLTALVAGCSGGNAGTALPGANSPPSPSAVAKAAYAKVQLGFSFTRGASASARSRQFINGNATASFTASVNGGKPVAFNCTKTVSAGVALFTCSGSVDAPLNQVDTFVVNTYDAANGTGYLLSTNGPSGYAATVLPNRQNNVNIATKGVVASIAPVVPCAQGGVFSINVPLQFLDADGGVISGPASLGGTMLANAIVPVTLSAAGSLSNMTVGGTPVGYGATVTIDGTQPVALNNQFSYTGSSILTAAATTTLAGAKTLAASNVNFVPKLAFVTDTAANSVSAFDASAKTRCMTFSTGTSKPSSMAISTDGKRVFVGAGNAVTIFDNAALSLVGSVPVAGPAAGLAYDNGSNTLYVANGAATTAAAAVSTIANANACTTCSASALSITSGTAAVSSPFGLALGGGYLYFSNTGNASIDVVQLSSGYVFTASLAAAPNNSAASRGAAIVANGTKLYVQTIGAANGYLDTVSVTGTTASAGGGYLLSSKPVRTSPRSIAFGSGKGALNVGVSNAVQSYTIGSPTMGGTFYNVGSAPGAIDYGFFTTFAAFPSAGGVAVPGGYSFTTFTAGTAPTDVVLGADGSVCAPANAFSKGRKPKALC